MIFSGINSDTFEFNWFNGVLMAISAFSVLTMGIWLLIPNSLSNRINSDKFCKAGSITRVIASPIRLTSYSYAGGAFLNCNCCLYLIRSFSI